MKHPWTLQEGWQEGGSFYNVSEGSAGWDDYVSTVVAFYQNSFKVPSFAGFAILTIFGLLVFVATIRNLILTLTNRRGFFHRIAPVAFFQKHISEAPLFRHRHANVYRLAGNFFTIQAPLRGETIVLVGLLIVNLVPMVAFYTPYTSNNLYWPDDRFDQVGRYVSDRAGILATAQLVPLILLSGRSNPVTLLTGASFATCMLYHRWIARIVTVQILVHAIGYSVITTHESGAAGYISLWTDTYLAWGAVATVSFSFLCFFSLRWFRAVAYEWFVLTHVLFAILAIVGIFYHINLLNTDGSYADFINYIYASLFFYLFEKLVRVLRVLYLNGIYHQRRAFCTSVGTVSLLRPTSNILSISVVLQGRGAGRWMRDVDKLRAGLSVQLWIPRVQPLSSHPFTVAGIQRDTEGRLHMQLYAKVHKGITQRLRDRAQATAGGQCELSMLVEGFYGHQKQLSLAEDQILVAGGIGITHCLSYLQEAMVKGTESHLVWLMRDPALLAVGLDVMKNMPGKMEKLEEGSEQGPRKQTLSVYITRPILSSSSTPSLDVEFVETAGSEEVTMLEKNNNKERRGDDDAIRLIDTIRLIDAIKTVHPFLKVHVHTLQQHPDLKELVTEAVAKRTTSQTALLCCGPAEMLDSLRQVSRQLRLDYHEEAFSW